MPEPVKEIEVEVVEIDGIGPVARPQPEATPDQPRDWRRWQGRVRRLDSRWWPLWVILGLIAVVLALTVGVVVGVVFLIVRTCMNLVRALLR
jgi:hypothetical protein